MPNTPLSPDAVDRVAKALMDDAGYTWGNATEKFRDGFRHHARIALAAALPVVNSVEELDALPVGSVVRGGEDDLIGEKIRFSPYLPHWCTTGEEEEADKRDLLPARVLYRPTEESTNGR